MTHRDLAWRGGGVALFVLACAIGAAKGPDTEALGLLCFIMAIVGLVLAVQGRRVPAAWRIERGRHRALAQAIRHRRSSRGNS